jgi:hypothetical protein
MAYLVNLLERSKNEDLFCIVVYISVEIVLMGRIQLYACEMNSYRGELLEVNSYRGVIIFNGLGVNS